MSRDDDSPRIETIDLSAFSIEELEDRIATLEAEIDRARALIGTKQAAQGAADSVFKI